MNYRTFSRNRWNLFFTLITSLALFTLAFQGASTAASGGKKKSTRITGRAVSANGAPLTGLIAIETGRLYSKEYKYGGLIDKEGRFNVTVPGGGDYGIHIYATGHIYFPVGVTVKEGEDNHFNFRSPPNEAVNDAPLITSIRYIRGDNEKKPVIFKVTVEDPNNILSYQVLGVNVKTGEAFRLSPPEALLPWTKNYPNGEYSLTYVLKGKTFNPRDWYFVAANNRCYTSPILGYPFTDKGVLKVDLSAPPVTLEGEMKRRGSMDKVAEGKEVFDNNCTICHYRDKEKTKVGPGLKGLFKRKLTPKRKLPLTEKTIRTQIQKGGIAMPPYSHIKGEDLDALLEYLKTL